MSKVLLLPLVLVGLLVIASVGLAGNDGSNPPGSDLPQVTSVEPQAMDALSVFEDDRIVADRLPDLVSEKMDEHASFGRNPHLARLSIGNATNAVYLVPAHDHVCVVLTDAEGASVACPSTEDIARGQAGPGTAGLADRDIAIYGVVPNGVKSVLVNTDGSSTIEMPTENNAYYTVVPAGTPIRTVSYTGPSGPVEFSITDPALAFEG
jgi:hypothetical protein